MWFCLWPGWQERLWKAAARFQCRLHLCECIRLTSILCHALIACKSWVRTSGCAVCSCKPMGHPRHSVPSSSREAASVSGIRASFHSRTLRDGKVIQGRSPPSCLPPTSCGSVLKGKWVSHTKLVVVGQLSLTVDLGHLEEVRARKHNAS